MPPRQPVDVVILPEVASPGWEAPEVISLKRDHGRVTYRDLIALLRTIPGVGTLAAITIWAEIGRDMSRFPSRGHLLA